MFDKILIANRGEIACRVIRTARRLGVRTVAVYSDADQNSLHVKMADEARHIGPSEVPLSYLNGSKILEVAKQTGAQAIHPGYGFLSENAEFADLCHAQGVTFIGPPGSAIRQMGSKSASKYIMEAANVPVIPGYHGDAQDLDTLIAAGRKIGYPLMIKAVMGGGGRGMRVCHSEEELPELVESAQRESANAFGDSRVLLEKYITQPRHIELQVFADGHGNCVYVFERDCSVQRRNQKVIEEAPAPFLTPERRALMGEAAVNAAKAVGYVGAGTVEFIVDTDHPDPSRNFYFMEMNTRLQVEHPITEMISGADLVEWQLRVAAGNRLPVCQDDLKINGHAFEARIYAEDPSKGFVPGYGRISHLQSPETSANVRIDTGVQQGDQISTFYDNMIAKLIVWDHDRVSALRRLRQALSSYQVVGLVTNTAFLKKVADHPAFVEGGVTTKFIPQFEDDLIPKNPAAVPAEAIAIASLASLLQAIQTASSKLKADHQSPFSPSLAGSPHIGFRVNASRAPQLLSFIDQDVPIKVRLTQHPDGSFVAEISRHLPNPLDKKTPLVEQQSVTLKGEFLPGSSSNLRIILGNKHNMAASIVKEKDTCHVFFNDEHFTLTLPTIDIDDVVINKGSLLSPMPGTVKKVFVKPGDRVKKGQVLVIVYAMKTELPVKAAAEGVVKAVHYKENEIVEAGTTLLSMEEPTTE